MDSAVYDLSCYGMWRQLVLVQPGKLAEVCDQVSMGVCILLSINSLLKIYYFSLSKTLG